MPELLDEWMSMNGANPETVGAMDHTPAWWKCRKCGGEWRAPVHSRTLGAGCPYCAGRRVLPGVNDLKTLDPATADLWDYQKNGEVRPEHVAVTSKAKMWWIVDGVSMYKSVVQMHNLKNLPKVVRMTTESLGASRPDLMREWSPRNKKNPMEISVRSSFKAWWKCDKGHTWRASVSNRTQGSGCPYCSGRLAIPGENDLPTLRPDVMRYWSENNDIDPQTLKPGSNRKVEWICARGHAFLTSVVHMCSAGTHCPVCNGYRLLRGYNDLATVRPNDAKLWASDLNGEMTPCDVQSQSHRIVWWRCDSCGSTWRDMVNGPLTCPTCWAKGRSSGETELYDAILGIIPDRTVVRNDRSVLNGRELDVYIPDFHLAFEFNGLYWHDENHHDSSYHEQKWKDCRQAGVRLIQVWEDDWNNRRRIVLDHIRVLLHCDSDFIRIGARKCSAHDVQAGEARDFLDRYHIQGFVGGSVRKALFHEGKMMAVLVCSRQDSRTLTIERYATRGGTLIQGGFTKLLKDVLREHSDVSKVLTFSDHTLSEGTLYLKSGFVRDGTIPADYSYIVHGCREHKFGFRKSRFKSDPNLVYQDGCTERELARINGLRRIWDAGKTRWVFAANGSS